MTQPPAPHAGGAQTAARRNREGYTIRQLAFYGKGGIGKSTTAANVSAALAELGHRVMQVGCDPKHDSTRNLVNGRWLPTILDVMRRTDAPAIRLDDVAFAGYRGVMCLEVGGPEPGIGCGGRGIIAAIELLEDMGAFTQLDPGFVIYDVLGDVVCGGFAMPLREGYAEETYIVTSGELMALYAANNICRGIKRFSGRSRTRLAGIIGNGRRVQGEEAVVGEFASRIGSHLMMYLPQDDVVRSSELKGQTVVQHAPDSPQAARYRLLAERIVANQRFVVPEPAGLEELVSLVERASAAAAG
jgi:nitrogenase iron protein NifH